MMSLLPRQALFIFDPFFPVDVARKNHVGTATKRLPIRSSSIGKCNCFLLVQYWHYESLMSIFLLFHAKVILIWAAEQDRFYGCFYETHTAVQKAFWLTIDKTCAFGIRWSSSPMGSAPCKFEISNYTHPYFCDNKEVVVVVSFFWHGFFTIYAFGIRFETSHGAFVLIDAAVVVAAVVVAFFFSKEALLKRLLRSISLLFFLCDQSIGK